MMMVMVVTVNHGAERAQVWNQINLGSNLNFISYWLRDFRQGDIHL